MLKHHGLYQSRSANAASRIRFDHLLAFINDADYCIDAPDGLPRGSTVRVDPDETDRCCCEPFEHGDIFLYRY